MAKRRGIGILGGMYPSTVWGDFPQVNVLRPLLEVRRADLQEMCRNEGVEWIEDPSNLPHILIRNNVLKVLQENEKLVPGIAGLVKTGQEARRYWLHRGIVANTAQNSQTKNFMGEYFCYKPSYLCIVEMFLCAIEHHGSFIQST